MNTTSGERLVGETGGGADDLAAPKIEDQFHQLTEDVLGSSRVKLILDRLWRLEQLKNIAEIPAAFVFA